MKKLVSVLCVSSLLIFLLLVQVASTPEAVDYPTNPFKGEPFGVGRVPTDIVSGDFDNNAVPDLAVTNSGSNTVKVLCFDKGNNVINGGTIEAGIGPRNLAVGDFNNDGNQDLVVANELSKNVTKLLGDGKCTFSKKATISNVGNAPGPIAVGDFDRNGQQDFIVVNELGNEVFVCANSGEGAQCDSPFTVEVGKNPSSITVGDFNGNGEQGFVVTNKEDNSAFVCLDLKGSTPHCGKNSDSYIVGLNPVSIAPSFGWGYLSLIYPRLMKPMMADFNRDHCQDLVIANHGEQNQSGSIAVLLGVREAVTQEVEGHTFTKYVCTGKFKPAINYRTDGNGPSSVVVGQFNNDSLQDIAVINQKSNSLTIFLAQCCNDNQCFPAQCCTAPGNPPKVEGCEITFKIVKKYECVCYKKEERCEPCDPYKLVVFDKNRDGIDDLAITCKNSEHPQENSTIFITHGIGDGKFGKKKTGCITTTTCQDQEQEK